MRILHTSDWHLGRTLEGRSRQHEQEAFVDEICRIADDSGVHLVLIAGDIFDTYNPPAFAEELYCYALERLAQGRKRAVVVIAGNHDSPDRLTAVRPLALRHGAFIAGLPGEMIYSSTSGPGARLIAAGKGWLEISAHNVAHSAIVSILPYPSESRLQQVLSSSFDEHNLRQAYSSCVQGIFNTQAQAYRTDTVNLAVSHLFVLGGLSSDSERPIEVGGACTVDTAHLPENAQYIALGHLHRAQEVKHAASPTFYSGSPLAYSFSEAGQTKVVYIVDVEPGQKAMVEPVNLTSGAPLERWRCVNGVDEVMGRLDRLQGRPLWLDIEVHSPRFLTLEESARLRQAHEGIINVRCVVQGAEQALEQQPLATLSVPEIFTRFYKHRRGGVEPSEELVQLFTRLTNKTSTEEKEVSGQ